MLNLGEKMICFIALFVFAILGLFSAKYRSYFFEASDCVFRKMTLRKCTTSFDNKMKMKITTKISKVNKSLAGFIFKHFDLLSWILTIIMLISLIWTAYLAFFGLYNFFLYGNCDGPNSTAACVYGTVANQIPNFWDFCGDNLLIIIPGIIIVLTLIWGLFLKKK